MSRYFNISGEKVSVGRAVLGVLGVAGLVSVAVLAPNALQLFRSFKTSRTSKKLGDATRLKYDINATITRLQKEECIALEKRGEDMYVRLTEKGKKRLDSYQSNTVALQDPRKWDGKWRVVIFDVTEEKRSVRDRLRRGLKSFGFVRLQQSAWVLPYDCEDVITMLKTDQKLWGDVLYILAEKVEGDEYLRKLFRLTLHQ